MYPTQKDPSFLGSLPTCRRHCSEICSHPLLILEVCLPPTLEGEAIGTNPITAAEKEVEGKLLPHGEEGENDVELLEDDSDVEFLGGGGKEGDIAG